MDKFLTPRGFWDKFITSNVIGLSFLGLLWIDFSVDRVDGLHFAGLLIGLFVGQLDVCLVEISGDKPKSKALPRSVFFLSLIGVILILAFISGRLLGGYIEGLGITFCFGSAVIALVKKHRK